jgi:hypothetical protein
VDKETQAHWGRIGGLVRSSRYPREQLTIAARLGFDERFRRMVDPEGVLDIAERERRAAAARRAWMLELAQRSALARARRKAAGA